MMLDNRNPKKRARIEDDAPISPPALRSFMEASRHSRSMRNNVKRLIKLNRHKHSMSTEQVEALFINLPPRVSYPTMMINVFGIEEKFKRLRG